MDKNGNGLNVNISQQEFMSKPVPEQNWLLFESIININKKGCEWSRKTYGSHFWKKFYVLAGALGAAVVAAITILRFLLPISVSYPGP